MKRTRRHWPAFLSLLLLAAVTSLWVRSKHACDAAVLFLPGEGKAQVGGSFHGKLYLVFTRVPFGPERAGSMLTTSGPADQTLEEVALLADRPAVDQGRWGFRFARGAGTMHLPEARGKYLLVAAPHWVLAVLLSIPPLLWIRGLVRHWRWRRTGRCLHCGYDLRGSDGACPECGAGPAVSGAPSRPATAPASG